MTTTNLQRNLKAAYNTLIERRDACLSNCYNDVVAGWAEAYNESAGIVAAALEASGIQVLPKQEVKPSVETDFDNPFREEEQSNQYKVYIYNMEENII